MSEQTIRASEIPSPPLEPDQQLAVKENPLPNHILQGMRNDMAARKANAGPGLSDEEVLARILVVGLTGENKQGGGQAESAKLGEEEGEVLNQADAVRNFVRTVLSFLAKTNAAKALQFRVFIPPSPVVAKPDVIFDEKGQSTFSPKDEGAIGRGKEGEIASVEGLKIDVDKTIQPGTATPPTISFSDALELLIPLWPDLIPPAFCESESGLAKSATQDAARKSAHVLTLTVALFRETMGHDRPIGYENDLEIWHAVQNLLHLYLSPSLSAVEPSAYTNAKEKATEQFIMLTQKLTIYAQEHPYKLAGQVALGVVGFFPGVVLGPILGVLGFGATGVVGGSAAAAWQASFGGNIAAGSLFSMCQSFAMGGAGGILASGFSAGAAAVAAGVGALRGSSSTNESKAGPIDTSTEEKGSE